MPCSRVERVAVLYVNPNVSRRDKLPVCLTPQDAIQATEHPRGIIGMEATDCMATLIIEEMSAAGMP